jgi:hypothetical protein
MGVVLFLTPAKPNLKAVKETLSLLSKEDSPYFQKSYEAFY